MCSNKNNADKFLLEEDLQDIYENAPCGYLSTLPNGEIIKVNATFLAWTGYDSDFLQNTRRFQDLLSIAGRIYYDTHYVPLLQMQGFVNEVAFDLICQDGQRLPILLNSALKHDAAGKPLFIRTTLLDARSRRAYEQELLLAKRNAEQAQASLRHLTENLEAEISARTAERDRLWGISQDILAIASLDGVPIRCNPAFTAVLGWSEQEAQHIPLRELVHPDDRAAYEASARKLAGGHRVTQSVDRRRHKDGSYRWISWNIVPENQLIYLVGRDVTEEKEQAEALVRLKQMATHDSLTGLPNRTHLAERLQHMLDTTPQEKSFAVMFIDLDRFKEVNDSMGHGIGDSLLVAVAQRLQKNLRPSDLVARISGDEFVVVASCPAGHASVAVIAEKLVATLAARFNISGHDVSIGASIGISMFPQDGITRELLFQKADTAMYRAKAAGRNGYRFFEADMSEEERIRATLETSLPGALERNELELYYQPRVNLQTMKLAGVEALVRWKHPRLGIISPTKFLSIVEDNKLIEPIGYWILQEACRQAQLWNDKSGRRIGVSVNLSSRQLHHKNLLTQVVNALDRTGLPSDLLELEFSEDALMDDPEEAAGILHQLRELGVRLAVDDFGAGYSSLAYLFAFPLQTLKLDPSFVRLHRTEVNQPLFIKAFVHMAHTLNLSVVAKSVESEQTLQLMREAGCNEAQGYFLAPPLQLSEFEKYVADQFN